MVERPLGFFSRKLHSVETRYPAVTLGLYRNWSVNGIKDNQATFDNSQRNNLRSCVWVPVVVFGLSLFLSGGKSLVIGYFLEGREIW